MSRKTATAEKQPDLLGAVAPKVAPTPKPIAKVEQPKPRSGTKKKTGTAVSTDVAPQDRVHQLKNTAANTLSLIAEALKDPSFKPESMRMVLDMHKEMVAEQARLDFVAAKRALTKKLPVINKDGKIEYRDKGDGKGKPKPVRFASFENINEVIRPLLDEFGFDLWFSSEPGATGMLNVIGHLDHENGHARATVFPMPHDASGGKSGAQGWASAFSFGKRVSTIGLLNIRTTALVDRDTDGNGPNRRPSTVIDHDDGPTEQQAVALITEKQSDALVELLEVKGRTRQAFCKAWHIEKVSDLPAEFLQKANDALKALPDAQ